jgi:Uma2 family endonuclease
MISMKKRPHRKKDIPPLENGDHLDQKTFHERYEAMPSNVRAELIGGIVFMSSPMKRKHSRHGIRLSHWIACYEDVTSGTESLEGVTGILGKNSELQPDGCLIILPEFGGQTWGDEDGYVNGAPEWVGEVGDSTESIDLTRKKTDYEKAGVREYVVFALRKRQIFWFVRQRGKFKQIDADADGIFRSQVFPGLWLDGEAFFQRNGKRVLEVLWQGAATAEHAAFVAKLEKQRLSKASG